MMSNPITPKEAISLKNGKIPDEVIDSFNELIAEHLSGGAATILQKDVIARINSKFNVDIHSRIFKEHWLDVEDLYRKSGWKVEYDRPGFNETHEPIFTFEAKEKK